MDIYKEWKKLEESKFSTPIKKEEVMNAIYRESNSTVSELKKRLGYKMNWSLFFALLCLVGMVWVFANTQALLIFGLGFGLFITSYIVLRLYHRKMDKQITEDANLLETLKSNEKNINSALAYETNSVLLTLPILITGAVLFSDVYSGQTILEAISELRTLIVMVVVLAVGFPFVHFSGAKMNKIAFGAYLNKLRKNINQLELLD